MIAAKINQLKQELASSFKERDEVIEGALAAILSKQHCLLIGPPGTAKSQLIATLCSSIEGANYFQWLLTKFTTPEELFGPYSLKDLEAGTYKRITTNKLPEAHIVFLDEVFKASSAILNTLLTLINERIFYNDSTPVKTPLISLFGASNELPFDREELGALYDRFLLRFEVKYISDANNFFDLLTSPDPNIQTRITLKELKQAQEEVQNIRIRTDILATIISFREVLASKGIIASDRRWKQAVLVLKAYAWMAGRDEVDGEDLANLQHMLWDEPQQRKDILKAILQIVNPDDTRAIELEDMAVSVVEEVKNGGEEAAIEAIRKLKNILSDLHKLKESKKVKEVIKKVEDLQKTVMQKALGIEI